MRPRKPDPPERVEFDHVLLDLQLRAMLGALPAGSVPERLLQPARQLEEALTRRSGEAAHPTVQRTARVRPDEIRLM